MSEYTTVASNAHPRGGNKEPDLKYVIPRHNATSTYPREPRGPSELYDYDLFAVINHDGQINNGHYTNFARYCDEVLSELDSY